MYGGGTSSDGWCSVRGRTVPHGLLGMAPDRDEQSGPREEQGVPYDRQFVCVIPWRLDRLDS